jgi:hypothetical protein
VGRVLVDASESAFASCTAVRSRCKTNFWSSSFSDGLPLLPPFILLFSDSTAASAARDVSNFWLGWTSLMWAFVGEEGLFLVDMSVLCYTVPTFFNQWKTFFEKKSTTPHRAIDPKKID